VLAFFFGYTLIVRSVLRSGGEARRALSLAFASDIARSAARVREGTDRGCGFFP
jgi:hypothetical protein